MDEQQRALCDQLRSMEEAAAAAWLRSTYPPHIPEHAFKAFRLLPHRPWTKRLRNELLDEYFCLMETRPMAHATLIRAATKMMPAWQLCALLARHLPTDKSLLDLLAYHALPVLKHHCQTDRDRQAVAQLSLTMHALARRARKPQACKTSPRIFQLLI